MAKELREWLERLNLGHLASVFEDNQVVLADLPLLNDDDLKELGLALGPRRRLLHAAAAMTEGTEPEAVIGSDVIAPALAAERRHLCVMFADMVGSTELSRRLDPEDLSRVMRRYQEAVSNAVSPYGGHVAKFLGDGVLVFFGWPQAYEDQVERAVRAGLNVIETVSASRADPSERLEARVGIATGNVVVGDIIDGDGRDSNEISGETPNLAARLQQLANPGEVVIDAACARQVGQAFTVTDLGEQDVKGFETGVQAWLVIGESQQADNRFQAARGTALSPMVGRDTELRLLLDRWELACGGEGQAVFISGEAGIGKSRLVKSLQEDISTDDHTPIRYQCSPHHTNSALYPAIRQLERAARFGSKDSPDTKLDKLEAVLARADTSAVDAPYFADLLSLPGDRRYGPLAASPQQKLEHLLEALLAQLLALAEHRPVLFLLEDSHWIDPTSLTLLERILAGIQQARVLIAVTHRPQWRPPNVGVSHVTSLQLNRLGKAHGAAVVRALSGADIDPDLIERIVARTDGVPLFIEELTKSLLEVGPETGSEEIPATLQASLTERLDRLGSAKEIAQIGAVIGRDFPLGLVAAVTDKSQQELEGAVDELVRSELLFRKGQGAELQLMFKHALVRDTAYETLLIAARRDWHRRIAATLESRFASVLESEPEVIAQHWIEAAETRRAIPLLLRAGRLASARSATMEAVAHFQRALDLFDGLTTDQQDHLEELEILISLGPALMNAKGFAHPDVGRIWDRAEKVNRLSRPDQDDFLIAWNLWLFHHIRNDWPGAQKWCDVVVRLAEEGGQEEQRLEACHAVWTTDMPRGLFAKVRDQCEAGISIYNAERHHHLTYSYGGHDPGVCGHGQFGLALSTMGYLERGAWHTNEAISLGNSLGHGPSQTVAWGWWGLAQAIRRGPASLADEAEIEALIGELEKGIGVIDRYGPPHFRPNCQCVLAWVKVVTGNIQEGLAEIRSSIDIYRATGATLRLPIFQFMLAEIYLAIKDFDGAAKAVDDGLQIIDQEGDRTFWAELMRVRGEIALANPNGGNESVEMLFQQAIAVASNQGAKLSELRSRTRLADHLLGLGRRGEARDLLAQPYGWFTEGLNEFDLLTARQVLDRIS